MNENELYTNQVRLSGIVVRDYEYSHSLYGEGFYILLIENCRLSGQEDLIPVMISERLTDIRIDPVGKRIHITGQFRSFHYYTDTGKHLRLTVFAREAEFEETTAFSCSGENSGVYSSWEEENLIYLEGCICRKPIYRVTPLGREIADLTLSVSRAFGKNDYIPCIAWGRNARFCSGLEDGNRIYLQGRIQSRKYQKKLSEGVVEERTAYEVSISKVEYLDNNA